MKKIILIISLVSLVSVIEAAESLKHICVGNNVNIRKSNSKNGVIVGKLNFGDEVDVVSDDELIDGDQTSLYKKIRYKNNIFYISSMYVSDSVIYVNPGKNYIYTVLTDLQGASNGYLLFVYNVETNKKISITIDMSELFYTKNFDYIVVDKGSYVTRDLTIYRTNDLKKVFNCTYLSENGEGIIIDENKIIFKKFDKGYYGKWVKVIYENGKIRKTSETGNFID